MPKENKIIQPKDLSIHYFVNGFSFCTHSKIDFIPTPKGASDFKKALEDFFDRWEKGIFLEQLEKVLDTKWNYERISKSVRGRNSTEEIFRKRIEDIITF